VSRGRLRRDRGILQKSGIRGELLEELANHLVRDVVVAELRELLAHGVHGDAREGLGRRGLHRATDARHRQ